MSGNYGGNSIPTIPIGGDVLYAGRNTAYKGWMCSSVVADATQTFTYSSQTVNVSTSPLEFVMYPALIGTVDSGFTFFCYDCSCRGVMSGSTAPSSGMTNPSGPFWNPVIIGGNGLNS